MMWDKHNNNFIVNRAYIVTVDIVSSSSNKPDQTLVSENNPPQGDSLYNSLDSQQSEDRQNTEQNTSLWNY